MKEFFDNLISTWWGITVICVFCLAVLILLSALLYRVFFKRFYDMLLSGIAIVVLSPLLLILIIVGAVKMKGNPFFTQQRPGKKRKNGEEKIFKLIKFRTMTCEKDNEGNLLPDEKRLTKYGKFLRSTSLDELPELFNIFVGHMAIVGPRPLLVRYLPLYSEEQRHRHDVRPGLTGYAQVHGRNAITWAEKFKLDIDYVHSISLWRDTKIIFQTVGKVFKRSGISQEGQATMEFFTGNHEYNVLILSAGRRVELINCFKAARDRLKIDGKVCAADITSTAPALYFADEKIIVPRIDDDGYIDAVIDACKTHNISLVVPTIDTELIKLAQNKDRIESETGACVLISNMQAVEVCCDKRLTAKHFDDNGFKYPKTYDEKTVSKTAEFPLFIKPRDGSSSIGTYRIENKTELDFFLKYVKNPIVQECVSGKEYTVDCFCDFDGNILSVVPRWRMRTRGGEVLKGKIEKNAAIIDDVKRLLNSFGFIGQITVQCFLTDGGEVKYIEINPRFGGGAPMSIAAGADSCEKLYRLLRCEKLEYSDDYEDGAVYSRFDSSVKVDE
ncbi:MAG: ATP-grasp domain-containing protein [Clostridiales bacterium]|nr:ATP-grasp domain-containing protein [Clostridiales bacterium]